MLEPLVSIVIPCYNHQRYVKDCILSVIDQCYENIELIIIDDGSSDTSVDKIKSLVSKCEQRFSRFEFRSRENRGLCATLNEGIEWCHGEYYATIASDDVILSNKTLAQVNFLEKNANCVAVFGGVYLIDEMGNILKEKSSRKGNFSFKEIFLKKKYFYAPTQMLRLNELKKSSPYPRNIFIEDWYMWLKLTARGGVVSDLGFPLAKYRIHTTNSSNNSDKMREARYKILSLYRSDPNYRLANAIATLSCALDLPKECRAKKIALVKRAVKNSPAVLLDKHFFSAIFNIIF